jgi:hypothetical protein
MVSTGRIYIIVALILAGVVGLLFLIVRGSDPSTAPSLEPDRRLEGVDGIDPLQGPPGAGEHGENTSGAAAPRPSRHGASGATRGPEPRAVEEKPISLPEPAPGSENGPVAGEPRVTAFLVDRNGVPLPWTSVTVKTLSVPKTVLTRGPVRTDQDGRFFFRPPSASNVLHIWCPGLRSSAKLPWQPDDVGDVPLMIRLEGRALVGRLVDDAGQAPSWKGIIVRLALVPADGTAARRTEPDLPISVERRTGSFAAVIDSAIDLDLIVSGVGQTGVKQLRRIRNVTRATPPLVVAISDPRSFFGALTLQVANTTSAEDLPGLEVVWNRRRDRLHLSRDAGGVLRTGPLAGGVYLLRAVAGHRVSSWRRVTLTPDSIQSLGVLTLEDRAMLRIRPVFPDGSVDRGAKVRVFTEPAGIPVPVRLTADSQGFVGQDFSPARYRISVTPSDPRRKARGDAFTQLLPGGVHDVVVGLQ